MPSNPLFVKGILMTARRSATAITFAGALTAALAYAPAASATAIEVPVVATCTKGSTISLTASASGASIAITVGVDGSGAYHPWAVGVADNLTGVYAGVRVSNTAGDVAVSRGTADQSGTDNVGASAIDLRTGEVCVATLPVAG